MRVNSRMQAILPPSGIDPDYSCLDDLAEIIDSGWTVGPGGTLLLEALWNRGRSREIGEGEVGEYEYHTNDVYVLPAPDSAVDGEEGLPRVAARAFGFVFRMFRAATKFPESRSLLATISVPVGVEEVDPLLGGATVKFFTQRGAYPDWFDDLERFELEAIAVLSRSDLVRWLTR